MLHDLASGDNIHQSVIRNLIRSGIQSTQLIPDGRSIEQIAHEYGNEELANLIPQYRVERTIIVASQLLVTSRILFQGSLKQSFFTPLPLLLIGQILEWLIPLNDLTFKQKTDILYYAKEKKTLGNPQKIFLEQMLIPQSAKHISSHIRKRDSMEQEEPEEGTGRKVTGQPLCHK